MKNFLLILAVVVLIIATCTFLKFLSTVFDHTWNHSWIQPTMIALLFAFYGFLYKNKDKKLYYTDNEITVICPNCGCECDESNRLIFHKEKKGDETLCEGVVICSKCATKPATINTNRVYSNLIKWNWDRLEAERAEQAIEQFQNGDTEILMQI